MKRLMGNEAVEEFGESAFQHSQLCSRTPQRINRETRVYRSERAGAPRSRGPGLFRISHG